MDQLPAEILARIVRHLNSQKDLYTCTLINQTFYRATNSLLWRDPRNVDSDKLLTCLKAAKHAVGLHVRTLALTCPTLSDDDFDFMMQRTRHLERLTLQLPIGITDTSLQRIPQYCRLLKSLDVTHAPINQPTMEALSQHCFGLTRLSLNHCHQLGPDALAALVTLPLETLAITSSGPEMQTEMTATTLTTHFDRLTRLTLEHWNNNSCIANILSKATTAWPHLTFLSLSGSIFSDDIPLPTFLQSHPGLQTLLLLNDRFSDSFLDALAVIQHPGITCLFLNNNKAIKERGVRRLVLAWPLLEHVTLYQCRLTATMFPEASQDCLVFRNYPQFQGRHPTLRHLDQPTINKIRLGHAAGENKE